jgi:hypothetical protein
MNGKEVIEDVDIIEATRQEYRKKYGHEPEICWKIGKKLFVKGDLNV